MRVTAAVKPRCCTDAVQRKRAGSLQEQYVGGNEVMCVAQKPVSRRMRVTAAVKPRCCTAAVERQGRQPMKSKVYGVSEAWWDMNRHGKSLAVI
jgi:ribosomal protein L36